MFSRKPAAPTRRAASTVPAKPKAMPPAQQSAGGGMLSGIGSTIAQGMAFGTGSAIAHRAVGAVAGSMGGGSEAPESAVVDGAPPPAAAGPPDCSMFMQSFNKCLFENNNDIASC